MRRATSPAMITGETFTSLNSEQLTSLAHDIAAEARRVMLRAREAFERETIDRDARAALDRLKNIPGMVLSFLNRGEPYALARSVIAASTGIRIETIDAYWRAHLREEKKREAAGRRLEVYSMAVAGKSNAEISAATGLHKNTITRWIRVAIDARGQERLQPQELPRLE